MGAICGVGAYKARIEHLGIVLASLGIREPLELLPSTGGASTSRSVADDQYTADMSTENQQLHQNLEDADRVNAGLQADLDNANRANAGLRVNVDHANRTNMQLHAAVEDMTSQLKEQKGIARQKANDRVVYCVVTDRALLCCHDKIGMMTARHRVGPCRYRDGGGKLGNFIVTRGRPRWISHGHVK